MSSFGFSPPGAYLPQAEWYPVGVSPTGPGAPPDSFSDLDAQCSIFSAICGAVRTKCAFGNLKCHRSGCHCRSTYSICPFLPSSVQSNHTPPPTCDASVFSFFSIFHFMLGSAAFLSTAFDPVLTQNPKKAGRAGRKKWKTRRANGGKKHKSEPKRLRFVRETTYGPEGRGFESLTAYQKSSKSSDFEDFCFS